MEKEIFNMCDQYGKELAESLMINVLKSIDIKQAAIKLLGTLTIIYWRILQENIDSEYSSKLNKDEFFDEGQRKIILEALGRENNELNFEK